MRVLTDAKMAIFIEACEYQHKGSVFRNVKVEGAEATCDRVVIKRRKEVVIPCRVRLHDGNICIWHPFVQPGIPAFQFNMSDIFTWDAAYRIDLVCYHHTRKGHTHYIDEPEPRAVGSKVFMYGVEWVVVSCKGEKRIPTQVMRALSGKPLEEFLAGIDEYRASLQEAR